MPTARIARSTMKIVHQPGPGVLISLSRSAVSVFCVMVAGTCSGCARSSLVIDGSYVSSSSNRILLRALSFDLLEVRDAWLGVQLLEHPIAPLAVRELGDARLGIQQIAEHDRLRRTGLRARGLDLAIPHRAAHGL